MVGRDPCAGLPPRREPGPLEYQARDLGSAVNKPGGRFSTSFPKTFIELECYRAKSIPGPKYVTPIAPVAGLFGRISEARPKSAVDWLVYDAKQKPSPCDYVVKGKTRVDCSPSSGGGFGKGKSKGFIELEELRTSDHPAPGDYINIINRLGVYAILNTVGCWRVRKKTKTKTKWRFYENIMMHREEAYAQQPLNGERALFAGAFNARL